MKRKYIIATRVSEQEAKKILKLSKETQKSVSQLLREGVFNEKKDKCKD